MKKSNIKKIIFIVLAALFVVVIALVVANSKERKMITDREDQVPQTSTITGLAQVEYIEVSILESFPVQVNVNVFGNHPDGCTALSDSQVSFEQETNTFFVQLQTTRDADAFCTLALQPFEYIVSLPVDNLQAGEYTVLINGVSDTFTMDMDNTVTFSDDKG